MSLRSDRARSAFRGAAVGACSDDLAASRPMVLAAKRNRQASGRLGRHDARLCRGSRRDTGGGHSVARPPVVGLSGSRGHCMGRIVDALGSVVACHTLSLRRAMDPFVSTGGSHPSGLEASRVAPGAARGRCGDCSSARYGTQVWVAITAPCKRRRNRPSRRHAQYGRRVRAGARPSGPPRGVAGRYRGAAGMWGRLTRRGSTGPGTAQSRC
jgi:hypothetical protein